ncbi:hypothetical protein ACJJTC_016046 [Scirpophaga incertulas]
MTDKKETASSNVQISLLEARINSYFTRMQVIYDSSKILSTTEAKNKFLALSSNVVNLRNEFLQLIERLNIAKMQENSAYIPSFKTWESFEELYSYVMNTRNELTAAAAVLSQSESSSSSSRARDSGIATPAQPPVACSAAPDADNVLPLASTSLQVKVDVPTTTVLLGTARVRVYDSRGKQHLVRCLIDSGSQNHFVTLSCCKRLSLNVNSDVFPVTVNGFGGSSNDTKGLTRFTFYSRFDNGVSYNIEPLVVENVTSCLPTATVDISSLSYLTSVPLADDTFNIPSSIDVVLGAQLFSKLLLTGRIHGPSGSPDAVQTTLGFLLLGEAPRLTSTVSSLCVSLCSFGEKSLYKLIERFYTIEDVPESVAVKRSREEQECEELYKATTTREPSGRYSVSLPFKISPTTLGESSDMARKRFYALENKFDANPTLRDAYNEVVLDYLNKGYLLPVSQSDSDHGYIIPHHGVVRQDKVCTKLRLVLDASAKTNNGVSLNDVLHPGPNLQSDLFTVLLNFRLFPVAFCADVKQMYLRVGVHPEFRKYQRIFYRFSKDQPLQLFEFSCVCFGMSASPYLSLRTVMQLAEDEKDAYLMAAEVIQRGDYYMDDVCVSMPTVESACQLSKQLIDLFAAGAFQLTKWLSNSKELLSALPVDLLHPHSLHFGDDCSEKVLGVKWEPIADLLVVAKIHDTLSPDKFYHVSGEENPSDCLSRGLTPLQLTNHPFWFTGPSWLRQPHSEWPIQPFRPEDKFSLPELKPTILVTTEPDVCAEPILYNLSRRFSSWRSLLYTIVYILRFVGRLKSRGPILVDDLNTAELALLKAIQSVHFADVIKSCQANVNCTSTAVQRLQPFLVDGVLRVGGRLTHAAVTFDHKHPVLLPRSDHNVNLIIDYNHMLYCHAGPQLLMSILRKKYWILSGRRIVRSRFNACNACFRCRPKPFSPPVMASLPECRLQVSKSFAHTGIDYCGPFDITLTRRRGI